MVGGVGGVRGLELDDGGGGGGELRLYTGPGTNRHDPRDGRHYHGFGRAVLNNGGDSVALFTQDDTLVDIFAY